MTAWQLAEAARGASARLDEEYRRTLYGAWHTAMLGHADPKKVPPLDKVLAKPAKQKPARGVDEPALRLAFQQHNERVMRENGQAR
jgi:hypothetical protein